MNHVNNMTNEEMRIAVAEEMGYTNICKPDPQEDPRYEPQLMGDLQGKVGRQYVPDYPNDLNAMHEAEKILDPDDYMGYEQKLRKTYPVFLGGGFHLLHATAVQRCEAFLRVKGLYREGKG